MRLPWRQPPPAGDAAHGVARRGALVTAPATAKSDRRSALEFVVPRRARPRPRLNAPAWRRLQWAGGLSVAAALVGQLLGGGSVAAALPTALLLTAAGVAVVRFLLLDTAARRFWIVWLAGGLLAVAIAGAGPAGRWTLFALGLVFLLARRYRPLRHLTSGQRAVAMGLALVGAVLLILRPGWRLGGDLAHPVGVVVQLGRAVSVLLIIFWLLAAVHLLLGMRLHFLRLRPKLAISAMLVGLVPLLLLTLLGLTAIYGALGGARAGTARDTLAEWALLTSEGVDLPPTVFVEGFHWSPGDAGSAPDWTQEFWTRLERARARPAGATPPRARRSRTGIHIGDASDWTTLWTPADTAAYFQVGGEIWLLRATDPGAPRGRLDGWRLDEPALDRLSRVVGADVGVIFSARRGLNEERGPGAGAARAAVVPDLEEETGTDAHASVDSNDLRDVRLQGHAVARPDSTDLWHRPLYFGGAILPLLRPATESFPRDDALLTLQVSLADLSREFTQGEQNLNLAVLILLGLLALFFLFIEGVAAFFGLRIAGGIIGAVKELHRGTRRLAQGDLDARIDIPNEDEFGDLAHSFNEMTAAVEHGREVAVARERLLRELETAREIQTRLLPGKNPGLSGFDVAGTSVPSRQVGGDYFDFLDLGEGRVGVAVGDVSGKGMPAALLMSNLQASLQGQVIHPSTVADIVTRVNDLLVQSTDPHMFATFFYGVLDTRLSLFTCTNAGHNPPILQRTDGTVERLQTGAADPGHAPRPGLRPADRHLEPRRRDRALHRRHHRGGGPSAGSRRRQRRRRRRRRGRCSGRSERSGWYL